MFAGCSPLKSHLNKVINRGRLATAESIRPFSASFRASRESAVIEDFDLACRHLWNSLELIFNCCQFSRFLGAPSLLLLSRNPHFSPPQTLWFKLAENLALPGARMSRPLRVHKLAIVVEILTPIDSPLMHCGASVQCFTLERLEATDLLRSSERMAVILDVLRLWTSCGFGPPELFADDLKQLESMLGLSYYRSTRVSCSLQGPCCHLQPFKCCAAEIFGRHLPAFA